MKQIKILIPVILFFFLGSSYLFAQVEGPYNPSLDGHAQIKKAIKQARLENKHVFIMIGGNW